MVRNCLTEYGERSEEIVINNRELLLINICFWVFKTLQKAMGLFLPALCTGALTADTPAYCYFNTYPCFPSSPSLCL